MPLTAGELHRLRESAPSWFAVVVTLGAGCGLRQGEAAGLTVDRVDFLRRELTVDRQLLSKQPGVAPAFAPPKTERSYRRVPLAQSVVDELAHHIAEVGNGRDGLVLHRDGEPVGVGAFTKAWAPTRKAAGAGVPSARFHDTRHTYASILLSGGGVGCRGGRVPGPLAGMLLGTYAHLMPADHDRTRSVVEAALAQTPPNRVAGDICSPSSGTR